MRIVFPIVRFRVEILLTSNTEYQKAKMGREENVLLVLFAHRVAFGNLRQAVCLLDFRLEPEETEIRL